MPKNPINDLQDAGETYVHGGCSVCVCNSRAGQGLLLHQCKAAPASYVSLIISYFEVYLKRKLKLHCSECVDACVRASEASVPFVGETPNSSKIFIFLGIDAEGDTAKCRRNFHCFTSPTDRFLKLNCLHRRQLKGSPPEQHKLIIWKDLTSQERSEDRK